MLSLTTNQPMAARPPSRSDPQRQVLHLLTDLRGAEGAWAGVGPGRAGALLLTGISPAPPCRGVCKGGEKQAGGVEVAEATQATDSSSSSFQPW